MTGFELIASIIDSIAWPFVILVIIFLLKQPLSKLLLGLSKFKYNSLELDFDKEMNKIETVIEYKNNNSGVNEEKSGLSNVKKEENEILSIAKINPGASITLAWTTIENEIGSVMNRLAISPDFPPYNSVLKNVNLLREQNYIDDITYDLIRDFRNLRNKISHSNKMEVGLTYAEAERYFESSKKIVDILSDIKRK